MFQDLNPLDKPTALIEIIVMLAVAALLGFLIGYIIQILQKNKLKSDLRFNDDKYLTLNNRLKEIEKENIEFERMIGDLRNRKAKLLTELDQANKSNIALQNASNGNLDNSEVKSLNSYIARLKKDKEELKAKMDDSSTASNQNDIKKLEATNKLLNAKNKQLSEEADKAHKTLKALKSEQKTLLASAPNNSNNEEVKSLNANITRLKKDKEELKKKVANLLDTEEAKAVNNDHNGGQKVLTSEQINIKKLALLNNIGKAKEENKDALTEISGIGPLIEAKLNTIEIFNYNQISKFGKNDIENVTDLIEFLPGRIEQDEWVKQAKALVMENT